MSINNTKSIEEGTVGTDDVDVRQQTPASSSFSSSSRWGQGLNARIFIFLAVLVISVVAVAVALSTGKKQVNAKEANSSLIISGTEAIEDSFPYMVSIQGANGHFCGGSMIARDVVLTAAHCDDDMFESYEVVVGRHASLHNDGEVIRVKSRVSHPDYEDSDQDFMLVFLDHAYTVNNVDLVTLNSDTSIPYDGQEVKAMGWGRTLFMGNSSDVLQQVNLNVISDEECALTETFDLSGRYVNYQYMVAQWEYALCAVGVNGKDTCDGDSGGPLVVSRGDGGADIQVGVVSWGIDCGRPGIPGIYSQISTAYHWIQGEVCKGSTYASEAGFDCFVSSNPGINNPTYSPAEEDGSQWADPIVTKSPTYAPTEGSTWLGPSKVFRACSQSECHALWEEHGAGNFFIGSYADYGCFRKGVNYYWGEGGTEEDHVYQDLSGIKERILCDCVEEDCFV